MAADPTAPAGAPLAAHAGTTPQMLADFARALGEGLRGSALLRRVGQTERGFAAWVAHVYPALARDSAFDSDLHQLVAKGLSRGRHLSDYARMIERESTALGCAAALRGVCTREKLRIALRELAPSFAPIALTALETSRLAEAAIGAATLEAAAWATQRYGLPVAEAAQPLPELVVLGMGKLGGEELNVGSDVDLVAFFTDERAVVVHAESGVHTDIQEYYTRIVRRMVWLLEAPELGAPVFRVDLRLRPEGTTGPLVGSFASAVRYYENWGRSWERAALLRARPVAGSLVAGAALLHELSSFVYRKSVDLRIARDMVALAARIQAEQRPQPWDLKLAPGGIREAEFFVQTLQLIWGGRDARLRARRTADALAKLASEGFVTDREHLALARAYALLRTVEHRVQFATGLQTHTLPEGDLRARIAASMGYASCAELEAELTDARTQVIACFATLVPDGEVAASLEEHVFYMDDLPRLAQALGMEGPAGLDAAALLQSLRRRPDSLLGAHATDRHPELLARTLAAVAGASHPERAARGFGLFFQRLARPGPYVHMLATEPRLVERLAGLFAASQRLTEQLIARPHDVDMLVGAADVDGELDEPPPAAALAEGVDDEAFLSVLRRRKARATLHCGVLDLAGDLAPAQVGARLSRLAEQTCQAVFARVAADLPLVVCALGKLGGSELGYGSDLDLMFLFDDRTGRGEHLQIACVRAAQRALRLLSGPHGDGPGYELDTRLRPSGAQGLLVVSLSAFARYHGLQKGAGKADDWERQALVRARVIAGPAAQSMQAAALLAQAAFETAPPQAAKLRALKQRIEHELGRESARVVDLKWGAGGTIELDFLVQFLQRKYGRDLRVRVQNTDAAIGALAAAGYLDAGLAAELRADFWWLRRVSERMRIVQGGAEARLDPADASLTPVARSLGLASPLAESAGAELASQARVVMARVRRAFDALLIG